MTDDKMSTLQWWIDRSRELEKKIHFMSDYSSKRDQKIQDICVERNKAYYERDRWREIAHLLHAAYETGHEIAIGFADAAYKRGVEADGGLG